MSSNSFEQQNFESVNQKNNRVSNYGDMDTGQPKINLNKTGFNKKLPLP